MQLTIFAFVERIHPQFLHFIITSQVEFRFEQNVVITGRNIPFRQYIERCGDHSDTIVMKERIDIIVVFLNRK
jgi:hypothetical protein